MGTVAVLIDDGFDEPTFALVRRRLTDAGHVIAVLGTEVGRVVRGKSGKVEVIVEHAFAEHDPKEFDGLIVLAEPSRETDALDFLRKVGAETALAANPDGQQMLAAAGVRRVVRGAENGGDVAGAMLKMLHASPHADEPPSARHADYGRQTHGGQQYGTSGVSGQPVEDAGEVKDVEE
jgi:hypothetical protein